MADVEYGINVSNKYSLFYDEDHDPNEIIAQQLEIASSRKSAEEKAARKKEKKAAAAAAAQQTAPANVGGTEKKATVPTSQPQGKPAVVTDQFAKSGSGRPPFDKQNAKSEDKDRTARPVGGEYRGDETRGRGGGRPPRTDRGPRQERSNLPPRMGGGGGGFNTGTGGEGQQFGDAFHQREDRGGFGHRGNDGGSFNRARGPRRGGFGGRERGGRGGFNQGDDNSGGGGGFGFTASDNNTQGFGGGGGNENVGFGTYGGEEQGGGGFGGFNPERRGRGRGGRGRGRGFGGGRGRQFDRVSGSDKTGVKPMDKRDGSGSYNWGSDRDDAAGGNEAVTPFAGDAEQQTQLEGDEQNEKTRAFGEEGAQDTDQLVSEKEAEEATQKEFTLDEWKALQAPKSKPSFNTRHAGEGENDKTEWKKLIPLQRPVQAPKKETEEGDEDEDVLGEDAHHKKKTKEVPIEINFIDGGGTFVKSGRGTRGGRGGRGRRGGGEPGGFGGGGGGGADRPYRGRGRGGGGFGGRGGFESSGGGPVRGGGRRDVPYRMDDESFPQLSSSAAA